jgi:hypothetical protein
MTLDQLKIVIKPLLDIGFVLSTPNYSGFRLFRIEIQRDKTEHWLAQNAGDNHAVSQVYDAYWGHSPNSIEEAADDLINHLNEDGGMAEIIADILSR